MELEDTCGMRLSEAGEGCLDHAFKLGYQPDSGDYYCVLARSDDGIVPGKARPGGESCWYPYGGEEKSCDDFLWISSHSHGVLLRPNHFLEEGEVPDGALKLGRQEDDSYYVVVAHTDDGDIPGKAKEGICWYPFGGEERNAERFSYVIARCGKLCCDARVHLESQHGGNIRINEDNEVDANGETGEDAIFKVIRSHDGDTIKLQNEGNSYQFLAITKDGLTSGHGGHYCSFRPIYHKDNTVSFESVNFPGRHIGLNEDHTPRDPKKTRTGVHARFNVIEA